MFFHANLKTIWETNDFDQWLKSQLTGPFI